jgi:hypothetical protein
MPEISTTCSAAAAPADGTEAAGAGAGALGACCAATGHASRAQEAAAARLMRVRLEMWCAMLSPLEIGVAEWFFALY